MLNVSNVGFVGWLVYDWQGSKLPVFLFRKFSDLAEGSRPPSGFRGPDGSTLTSCVP